MDIVQQSLDSLRTPSARGRRVVQAPPVALRAGGLIKGRRRIRTRDWRTRFTHARDDDRRVNVVVSRKAEAVGVVN